ncbi:WD40 repeat protein [Oxalobacteraceae bacterium GrIS 1.11]
MDFSSPRGASRPWLRALLGWVLAAGLLAPARPGEVAPALRLDTGTHLAPIRAAAMDRAGSFVVTASEDKSARVWDAASGALLSVFRPPSAPGNDGKLYAVAMAPDGSAFAAAGWSANNDLYLVRRNDGQIIERISGLPDVVTHLAFSPDGKMLAAGLGGQHGVRLYAGPAPWRELRGDAAYAGAVHASAWAPDGKTLMVSSADGVLRSYDAGAGGLALRARNSVENGTPYGLAFSPDGRSVAAGSAERGNIVLLDAASGKVKQVLTPLTSSPARSLSVVAWSTDGKRIFAAGSWNEQEQFPICVWSASGLALPSLPAARDTITALHAGADGRLLYAGADTSWGMLDAAGRSLVRVGNNLLDLRHLRSRFLLAPDAGALAFRPSKANAEAFDTRQLAWIAAGKQWQAPQTMAAKTIVDNWFERQRPTINGIGIDLDVNEWSLSASVARGGKKVAIATNFKLRLYQSDGRLLWQTAAPATPWQIICSDDGRWVVAAFSDGTLRWYKAEDGAEQLAFFPHADGRRWVMWMPSGYFAASPGGESLIGWQVERGPAMAADFYPVSRFRAAYYRPDLISAVIGGALPAMTQPAVQEHLPPTARIVWPEERSVAGGSQIKLRLAVHAPSDAPVTQLRARINGQLLTLPLASLTIVPGKDDSIYVIPLTLPAHEAQILLFADNKYGASPAAPEATLMVKAAPDRAESAGIDLRPALYVLAIGVSNYQDPSLRLHFAAKDSTDLADFLENQQRGLYRSIVVRRLSDSGAKRDDILDGLEWIRRQLTARDVAMVFLAGHGVNDADGSYYFLPQDVDTRALKRSAVLFTEIRNTLVSLPGKAMFFIDTCHAGNVLGTALRSARLDTTAIINELSQADNGIIVFAATTGRQSAQESPTWGNGAFTKALLEGLRGQADYGKSGRVTHKMLDLYISERVKRLTDGAQSPVTIVPDGVPDFALVLNRR